MMALTLWDYLLSFTLDVKNEQADARRDGRSCLARPNSQTQTATGEKPFSCSTDHEQDW